MIKPIGFSKDTRQLLSAVHLFKGVPLDDLEPYLHRCEEWHINEGTVLLSPSEKNNSLFSVLNGRLAVHLNSLDTFPLATVERGECLGEISIIDGYHPSGFVVASEPSRLLRMSEAIFWELIEAVPKVNRNLLRILCDRMRHGRSVLIDKEKHVNIDALTGLTNRRGLEQSFAMVHQRCIEKQQSVCLIMADIDHFKKINDQHGHMVGDRVIALVAQLLRENMRTIDKVARYGGEEFAVILPDTELQEATAMAERVRAIISNAAIRVNDSDSLVSVTLSLGVAQMQAGESLDILIANADKTLYQAKNLGRNRVCALYNADRGNCASSEAVGLQIQIFQPES